MDMEVTLKEEVDQQGVYVPDVFELQLSLDEDGETINGVALIEDAEELEQAALFASIRQKGSDPMNPEKGVMWAECLLGEVLPDLIVSQIKQAIYETAPGCSVSFMSEFDSNGYPVLSYNIKVVM